ncbi:NB-ARC domain-containing protein [Floridanema aerugineum]|uniref:NB-ARC domain-containing protein n=1 Tax=Floridaenema aerugineum BLCC-F46 TaxID=3153654 RepID=A0ABV4XGK7_9CYAN
MTVEEALRIIDVALKPTKLNDVQEQVFRQSWEGQGYSGIAELMGYNAEYIKNIGAELWQLLSQAFREDVTKRNFKTVLRRWSSLTDVSDAQAETHLSKIATNYHQDWGEAPDVSVFYGRTEELSKLQRWITEDRCRLVALLGMGGLGKTALAGKLTEQIQNQFEYLIWRSVRYAPPLSGILSDLNTFFAQDVKIEKPETVESQISCLLNSLRAHRCLIVLDDWEMVLRDGDIAGYYRSGYEEYGQLLKRVAEERHQSCLLLMSREKSVDVASLAGETLPVRALQVKGLKPADAKKLLLTKGFSGWENGLDELIQLYRGHPAALKVMATTIQEIFNGDISQFIGQSSLVIGDIFANLIDQHFARLSSLGKTVMYWLAIAGKPVTFSYLKSKLWPSVSSSELLTVLESLVRRSLIEKETNANTNEASFTLQPVIMKYTVKQFIESMSQDIAKVMKTHDINELGLLRSHALIDEQNLNETILKRFQERWQGKQIEIPLKNLLLQLQEYEFKFKRYAEKNILLLLGEVNN